MSNKRQKTSDGSEAAADGKASAPQAAAAKAGAAKAAKAAPQAASVPVPAVPAARAVASAPTPSASPTKPALPPRSEVQGDLTLLQGGGGRIQDVEWLDGVRFGVSCDRLPHVGAGERGGADRVNHTRVA